MQNTSREKKNIARKEAIEIIVICAVIAAFAMVFFVNVGIGKKDVRDIMNSYLQENQVDVASEVGSIKTKHPWFGGKGSWVIEVKYLDEPEATYYYEYSDKEVEFIRVEGETQNSESHKYLFDFKENVKKMETPLPVRYSYFANENEGIILCVGEPAMGTYALQVYKTEDGGETWTLQTENNGEKYIAVRTSAEYLFISNDIGFIFDPAGGDRSARLRMTTNAGKSFADLDFVDDADIMPEIGTGSLPKNVIYDYYELPVFENGVLTVYVSQGGDGDFNGGKTVLEYRSKDMGTTWEFVKELERN